MIKILDISLNLQFSNFWLKVINEPRFVSISPSEVSAKKYKILIIFTIQNPAEHTIQYWIAAAVISRTFRDIGCHNEGPFAVNKPIENGEALIMPIPLDYK